MSVQIFTVPTLVSGIAILLPTFYFHGKRAKYTFVSKPICSTYHVVITSNKLEPQDFNSLA